jgi:hypothetical protein
MKNEFTINLFSFKVKARFNIGGPLYYLSGYDYKRYIPIPNKIWEGPYGSCIYTTLVEVVEIPRLSQRQWASFRLKGQIQNGQVILCDSSEVPFYLYKRCDKWSKELRDTLILYMGINYRFRDYIRMEIEKMIDSVSMNKRLIELAVFFKKYRKYDFVMASKRMRNKRLHRCKSVKMIQTYRDLNFISIDEYRWWVLASIAKRRFKGEI